ncbi:MAG: DNA repair protein RecN [Flavobacteriaceae bacterium]|nr:DNA repair protein RecN [Flavobacteriaceae bacterium]
MLTNLIIKNYALIDDLSVSFSDGLSIITGETGAGKSILLGGLGLILGNRADLSAIKDKELKCVIEAEFNIVPYRLKKLFEQEDLDYEDLTIIRREILPSGKSRAFINDSPVSLTSLKLVGERLIDIHSQHQTLQLTNNSFQFEVIDALAKNAKELTTYQLELTNYNGLRKKLEELLQIQNESNESEEYNRFLYEELVEAKLDEFCFEALEEDLEQLSNVEEIQQKLLQANQLLSEEQMGVLTTLVELKNALKDIASFSSEYEALFERVNSSYIELEDVFTEVESAQENIEANPERLNEVSQQINTINSLYQKHQVDSVEALLEIQQELEEKVGLVSNLSERITAKETEIEASKNELQQLAAQIHQKREDAIPKLTKQLEKILINLGMENAKFDIRVSQTDQFYTNGSDELSFLFSANKGGNFNELKKSASGGELSRIMLGIKAILSKYKKLPSIMFDEIDTGVSGDVAAKMGLLMEYMSEDMQVFTITHLPQIASKGNSHFKVYKEDVAGMTRTNLKALNQESRVFEIAEMLGGKERTETAMQHAKELLNI